MPSFLNWFGGIVVSAVRATVTRELAARVNEGAAPGDIVSDDAFKMRAHRMGGAIYPERTVTDSGSPVAERADGTDENERREFSENIAAGDDEAWYYPEHKKSYPKNGVTNANSQEAAPQSCVEINTTNTDSQEAAPKSYPKNGVTDDGIYLCVTHRIAAGISYKFKSS